jgi:outer membrane protein OmpA-like peptidoglycan-associated protein
VEARKAVQVAEQGQAGAYAPDELLEARKLLAKAEDATLGSDEQKHLAYLADRQARRAESQGQLEMHGTRLGTATERYMALQDQRRSQAEAGLNDTRRQLQDTQRELGTINVQLQAKDANLDEIEKRRVALQQKQNLLEQQLATQGVALTESERARVDAEKRAQAAIASLNELAQVKEEANETIITLSGAVLFKTGKSELLPIAEDTLNRVAAAFKQLDESQMVVIKGHTDSRGADAMNRQLSQARADVVRKYLVGQGVNANQLKAVGEGEAHPIASNESAEGRANNRRVEMVITKSKG